MYFVKNHDYNMLIKDLANENIQLPESFVLYGSPLELLERL